VLRFCVQGGGSVLAAFDSAGRLSFAATTARLHRRLSIGPGSPVRALQRRFGRRLRSAAPGVRRVASGSSRQLLFGVRGRRVTFVAVADSALLRRRSALRSQLRRAGLVRGR
jgi:hypothetical protein